MRLMNWMNTYLPSDSEVCACICIFFGSSDRQSMMMWIWHYYCRRLSCPSVSCPSVSCCPCCHEQTTSKKCRAPVKVKPLASCLAPRSTPRHLDTSPQLFDPHDEGTSTTGLKIRWAGRILPGHFEFPGRPKGAQNSRSDKKKKNGDVRTSTQNAGGSGF